MICETILRIRFYFYVLEIDPRIELQVKTVVPDYTEKTVKLILSSDSEIPASDWIHWIKSEAKVSGGDLSFGYTRWNRAVCTPLDKNSVTLLIYMSEIEVASQIQLSRKYFAPQTLRFKGQK